MTPWARDISYPTAWQAPDPRLEAEPACHDMYVHLSPDCEDPYKHKACSGDAWCEHVDQPVDCECPHHWTVDPDAYLIDDQ